MGLKKTDSFFETAAAGLDIYMYFEWNKKEKIIMKDIMFTNKRMYSITQLKVYGDLPPPTFIIISSQQYGCDHKYICEA